jgi:glycosyltransferase involved in cell wall biosynthesis/2-polyprenyl-3-methyl-5-hydroxy-6-metoxy-1,4-benzoquinol methylase
VPTRLEWTPELISRFWDGVAQSPALDGRSFARLVGHILMEFMGPWIPAGAACLDYGGGSGHLSALMAKAGHRVAVFEPSTQRAVKIAANMGGEPRFLGIISTHDSASFDFVVCAEVIEHIRKPDSSEFMRAMMRRIAPGGLLFLTTPFAENLADNEAYCPNCDHLFHRWQHQRSWQIADIESLMRQWGLATEWLGRVEFDDPHCIRDFTLRRRCGEPWPWLDGQVPVIGRGDHIVFIGRKPGEVPTSPCDSKNAVSVRAAEASAGSSSRSVVPPSVARLDEPLSVANLQQVISAGMAEAKAGGHLPIVVVPLSLEQIDTPMVVFANELLGEARPATTGDVDVGENLDGGMMANSLPGAEQQTIIIFPGSIGLLQRAVEDGRLPQTKRALVFEDRWRRVRSVAGDDVGAKNSKPGHGRVRSLVDRVVRRMSVRMRMNLRARSVQPWIDRRERDLLPTLLSPGAFPYRLSHVVEGRVLLGVSTLGGGGAERQMVNTAQGLRARGMNDVHLLVEHLRNAPENGFYLDKARRVVASVHESPSHDHGTSSWALQHPRFREVLTDGFIGRILSVASVIKELAPEVVQTSLDWTNITVGLAAALAGVPKIFISGRNLAPTHFEFFQWFMYPCYRALLEHPNVRMSNNSDAGRRDYARWLGLSSGRIAVIRNGLVTGEFTVVDDLGRHIARRKLGIAADTPVMAGVFRFSTEKRPLLWVQTAFEVKARVPDSIFLLCGVGPMEAQIRSAAEALGLGNSVRYLGVRDDIQTVFAAADLVLHTALQEGTPNALIEAQAMGIPVVTTPAFGAAEAIEHGVTGIVERNETPVALADAAVSILKDPLFRKSAREAGPKFVEAKFGFDRMVDDTLLAYADAGVSWALDFLPANLRHRAYIPLKSAVKESGHAWVMDLPRQRAYGDSADNLRRSPLIVLEDGMPLGPAHTAHKVVRSEGGGAFSHWEGRLYFSTSDQTDPTRNGREYVAVIPR